MQILDIEEKDKAVRSYAGMPEIDIDIKKLGVGGVDSRDTRILDNLAPAISKEISEIHLDIEKLSRQVNFELASYENIYEKVKSDINRIRHIPSIRPVAGGYLNSNFGYRQDPIDAVSRFHQGQDFQFQQVHQYLLLQMVWSKELITLEVLEIILNLIMLQDTLQLLLISQKFL